MSHDNRFGEFFFAKLVTKIQNDLKQIISSCSILVSFVDDLIHHSAKLAIGLLGNKAEQEILIKSNLKLELP